MIRDFGDFFILICVAIALSIANYTINKSENYSIAYNNIGNLNDFQNLLTLSSKKGNCNLQGNLLINEEYATMYQVIRCDEDFDYDDLYTKYYGYKDNLIQNNAENIDEKMKEYVKND